MVDVIDSAAVTSQYYSPLRHQAAGSDVTHSPSCHVYLVVPVVRACRKDQAVPLVPGHRGDREGRGDLQGHVGQVTGASVRYGTHYKVGFTSDTVGVQRLGKIPNPEKTIPGRKQHSRAGGTERNGMNVKGREGTERDTIRQMKKCKIRE